MSKIPVGNIRGQKGDTGDVTPAAQQILTDTQAAAGSATTARNEAVAARNEARDAADDVLAVIATNDGIMAAVLDTPGTSFGGKVDARVEAGVESIAPSVLAADPTIRASASAAASAAMDDEVAARNLLEGDDPRLPMPVISTSEFAYVRIDELGRIAFGVRNNGDLYVPHLSVDNLTAAEAKLVGLSLAGKTFADDGVRADYSYVATDAAGRIAESALDGAGQVPAWVLDRWLARFDSEVAAQRLRTRLAPLGVPAIADYAGVIRLVESRDDQFLTDGDSITQGVGDEQNLGGWPGRLATLLGKPVQNIGLAARASTDLAVRQGGVVPLLTLKGGQIPASGSVSVTEILPKSSWRYNSTGAFDIPGTLAGVAGVLRHQQLGTVPTDGFEFVRNASGSAVPIPARTPFIATSPAAAYLDATYITAPGRNNGGSTNTFMDVVRDVQAQIAHLSPLRPRFLVLSILTTSNENSSTSGYTAVMAANTRAARVFGDRFVDVRRHLIDHGLQLAGITPTSADLAAIAGDTIPPSLLSDGTHPNAAGYTVMAAFIYSILQAKGWA